MRAARALLYSDAGAVWATAEARGEFAPDHRARVRATATWVAATAASVVDAAYGAGGGSSVYSNTPDTLTTAGAVLAGAEVDMTVF